MKLTKTNCLGRTEFHGQLSIVWSSNAATKNFHKKLVMELLRKLLAIITSVGLYMWHGPTEMKKAQTNMLIWKKDTIILFYSLISWSSSGRLLFPYTRAIQC